MSTTGTTCLLSQENILDRTVAIKTGREKVTSILKILSRRTNYSFTYDADIIGPEDYAILDGQKKKLSELLAEIFEAKNLSFSQLENHIIIYRKLDESTPIISEAGREPVYEVSGKILDEENNAPLPFATIGIPGKGLGTVSNSEGFFSLKVSTSDLRDTLKISYIGYSERNIPVNQAITSHLDIKLFRDWVSIPEVIIRTRDPLILLRNAVSNIRNNYGDTPVLMTAFYRESIRKKDKIHLYAEAVLNIYKSSYTTGFQTDQVSVFKSRKIENTDISDTLTLKLQAGISTSLQLDGVKHLFDFINEDNFSDYNYRMTDIINIGDEAAFAIEFEQRPEIRDLSLYKGVIYINTDNYGIHRADFEINPKHLKNIGRLLVKQSPPGYKISAKRMKYSVSYNYINGRFYFNHSRGDLILHARKKKKFFGGDFDLNFELAVTDIDTINVKRFPREIISPRHSVFAETVKEYDPTFWGVDNFIDPEKDLKELIEKINARLMFYKSKDQ